FPKSDISWLKEGLPPWSTEEEARSAVTDRRDSENSRGPHDASSEIIEVKGGEETFGNQELRKLEESQTQIWNIVDHNDGVQGVDISIQQENHKEMRIECLVHFEKTH
ncbi:UNVERIFIED_CONTAM: hypothetical protein K2H54_063403, partial [Gekko kuhli]